MESFADGHGPTPRVELLWEPDCPNVEAARGVVREALERAGLPLRWVEWRIGADEQPDHTRGYGSPSILVDGQDVTGHRGGGSDDCCRVYDGTNGLSGVPDVQLVVDRLTRGSNPGSGARDGHHVAGVAVLAAIAGSACCWLPAALVSLGVSASGVAVFLDAGRPWLLVSAALLLVLALYLVERRPACPARRRDRALLFLAAIAVAVAGSFPSLTPASSATAAPPTTSIDGPMTRYTVSGLTCPSCAGLLERELARVPGVEAATVSYETSTVTIAGGAAGKAQPLRETAQGLGFDLRPVAPRP